VCLDPDALRKLLPGIEIPSDILEALLQEPAPAGQWLELGRNRDDGELGGVEQQTANGATDYTPPTPTPTAALHIPEGLSIP
jgi:hypothetical protein